MAAVGEEAGLVLYERNVALLTALRDDILVPRSSFFALEQVRKARAAGVPRSVTAHEDLLVLAPRRPAVSGDPSVPERSRRPKRPDSVGVRLLPATYVTMTPEQEETAVAALAGLLVEIDRPRPGGPRPAP